MKKTVLELYDRHGVYADIASHFDDTEFSDSEKCLHAVVGQIVAIINDYWVGLRDIYLDKPDFEREALLLESEGRDDICLELFSKTTPMVEDIINDSFTSVFESAIQLGGNDYISSPERLEGSINILVTELLNKILSPRHFNAVRHTSNISLLNVELLQNYDNSWTVIVALVFGMAGRRKDRQFYV